MDKSGECNVFVCKVNTSDVAYSSAARKFLYYCSDEDNCYKMISRLKIPIALTMDRISLQRPYNIGWFFDGGVHPK